MEHHQWYQKGLAAFSEGDYSRAQYALCRACQLSPGNVQYLVDYGLVYIELAQPQKAKVLFALALRRDPTFVGALYHMGNLFKSFSQLDRAIEQYDAALALEPNFARALNNRGGALQRLGRLDAAISDFRKALMADQSLEPAYLNLGRLLDSKGDFAGAIEVYQRAINNSVSPAMFQHLLDALQQGTPQKAPADYVRAVFDDLAPIFDNHLTVDLGYSLPSRMAEALTKYPPGSFPTQILVDLGCGTGLVGEKLSRYFQHVTGVDLSTRMLEYAEKKEAYHELIEADAITFLEQAPDGSISMLVAADVLIYIGELRPFFEQAARVLSLHGLLFISTEVLPESLGYQLQKTGRFGHSSDYVRNLAFTCGFELVLEEHLGLRKEVDAVIPGCMFGFRHIGFAKPQ